MPSSTCWNLSTETLRSNCAKFWCWTRLICPVRGTNWSRVRSIWTSFVTSKKPFLFRRAKVSDYACYKSTFAIRPSQNDGYIPRIISQTWVCQSESKNCCASNSSNFSTRNSRTQFDNATWEFLKTGEPANLSLSNKSLSRINTTNMYVREQRCRDVCEWLTPSADRNRTQRQYASTCHRVIANEYR